MEAPHCTVFRAIGILAFCTVVLYSAVKADDWNSKVGASDSWKENSQQAKRGLTGLFSNLSAITAHDRPLPLCVSWFETMKELCLCQGHIIEEHLLPS